MYIQKKFRFGVMAILAGLIVSTLPLSAQQVYRTTFDLPFAANWSGTILEPGEYTVTVEQGLAMRLIRIDGEGGKAITVANPAESKPWADVGRLTFTNVDGNYVIQRFDAGPIGQSFSFATPKVRSGQTAHRATAVVLSMH